jgi:hypothetical protein
MTLEERIAYLEEAIDHDGADAYWIPGSEYAELLSSLKELRDLRLAFAAENCIPDGVPGWKLTAYPIEYEPMVVRWALEDAGDGWYVHVSRSNEAVEWDWSTHYDLDNQSIRPLLGTERTCLAAMNKALEAYVQLKTKDV